MQGALEASSLHRNPQLISAMEVLKITGKLNVASVLSLPAEEKTTKAESQPMDEMTQIDEAVQYSQLQSENGGAQQQQMRRASISSVASLAVPRISPSDAPSSALLSTASRLRRLGLGPPKRAMHMSSAPALSPIKDSTVPRTRMDSSLSSSMSQLGATDPDIPTPPRQTLRHQNVSLDPSPLSAMSKGRLNYTGSPLTSAIGVEEDDEEEVEEEAKRQDQARKEEAQAKENLAPKQLSVIQTIPPKDRLALQPPSDDHQVKTRAVKINGRTYRVLHLIGKGGSSKVFKVLAPDNQVLALKKVSLRNLDEATLSGYVNEIELLRRLGNAENIVRLVDAEFNREHANLYIVMEYGEVDLCQLLRERADQQSCDYNFIRYCWQQMLHAVRIVHAAKVVHCDLKPANFLMVRGHLKLIDFGISKAIMNDTTNIVRENQVSPCMPGHYIIFIGGNGELHVAGGIAGISIECQGYNQDWQAQ